MRRERHGRAIRAPVLKALGLLRMKQKWNDRTGPVYAIGKWSTSLESVISYLGNSHFTETDPNRTRSGIEHYWCFKQDQNLAIAFEYNEQSQELFVASNIKERVSSKDIYTYIPKKYEPIEGILWN